jgi:hypothetical protein
MGVLGPAHDGVFGDASSQQCLPEIIRLQRLWLQEGPLLVRKGIEEVFQLPFWTENPCQPTTCPYLPIPTTDKQSLLTKGGGDQWTSLVGGPGGGTTKVADRLRLVV